MTGPAERWVTGHLVLPDDAEVGERAAAVVELRDVSLMDAPSRVLARMELAPLPLSPRMRVPFRLRAPAAEARASLVLRAQIQTPSALYLTTQAFAVPPLGEVDGLLVALERVQRPTQPR